MSVVAQNTSELYYSFTIHEILMKGKVEWTKFPDSSKQRIRCRGYTTKLHPDISGLQYHCRYRQSALTFS